MKELVLMQEVNKYVDKKGIEKEFINYYVVIPFGTASIKIDLTPKDYTSREILNGFFENKK